MRMNSPFRIKFLFLHLDVEVEVEVGVEAGHGQARLFTLIPQDVQASNVIVAGTLSICSCEARVLFDPGASHSFVSPIFASRMAWQASKMLFPFSVATPLSDELETDIFFSSCPVLVEGRELLVDLVLSDLIDFNVILGMGWLAQHCASLDCREKVVISNFPNDDKF